MGVSAGQEGRCGLDVKRVFSGGRGVIYAVMQRASRSASRLLFAAARARIAAVRPAAYAHTRNALDGAVSQQSPYITHGFVTLADVLAGLASRHALDVQHTFVYELGWRASSATSGSSAATASCSRCTKACCPTTPTPASCRPTSARPVGGRFSAIPTSVPG